MPNTPSFKNPPVIEVTFAVHFASLQGWQTCHFGQFWLEHLKDEFPSTSDAAPFVDYGRDELRIELALMPPHRRVVYTSEHGNELLQIQGNRFAFNWRKAGSDDPYPRYAQLFPRFESLFDRFDAFVKGQALGQLAIERLELGYVNRIDTGGAELVEALEAHVKPFNWSSVDPSYLPTPRTATAAWQFDMRDDMGLMAANLTHVKVRDLSDQLVLALSCSSSEGGVRSVTDWFDAAHNTIVFGFADLTTKDAQALWEREQ